MAENISPSPSQQAQSPPIYGEVTVDGLSYIERPQLFTFEIVVTTGGQIITGQRLTLPGVADFLMKGLSGETTQQGPPFAISRVFRIRIGNAEGTTWFFSGGLGIFDDWVFSPLCLGTGVFPFPFIPPVPIHANGSLIIDIQDVNTGFAGDYPYTIHLGFHGAYLIPSTGAGAGQGPLAFGGTGNGTVANVGWF